MVTINILLLGAVLVGAQNYKEYKIYENKTNERTRIQVDTRVPQLVVALWFR